MPAVIKKTPVSSAFSGDSGYAAQYMIRAGTASRTDASRNIVPSAPMYGFNGLTKRNKLKNLE